MSIDWKKAALELVKRLPEERLNERALHSLKGGKDKWYLACSGGVDSLAMVLWVVGKFGAQGKVIVHYNHKMRPEADAEEAFVKELARVLGVECICGERVERLEKVNEEALRELRMEFFKKAMEGVPSRVLITGHHLDDVAEMLFMRLTRGSGTQGLAAPRPVQRRGEFTVVVRPFLDLRKQEIERIMTEVGVQWCEDSSNIADIYFRNRVRKDVIPLLERIAPTDFWKGVQRSRELLEEDDNALEAWLESLVGRGWAEDILNMERVLDKPIALKRRLLQKWLFHRKKKLSAQAVDLFLKKIGFGTPAKVSCEGGWLVFDGKCVKFHVSAEVSNWGIIRLIIGGEVYLPSGEVLCAKWVDLEDDLRGRILGGGCNNAQEVYLYVEGKGGDLWIRQWVAGDIYVPLGLGGHTKKLQDAFIDSKIEAAKRHQLPVILNRDEIVWCPGLAISNNYKINKTTQQALQLTFSCS